MNNIQKRMAKKWKEIKQAKTGLTLMDKISSKENKIIDKIHLKISESKHSQFNA